MEVADSARITARFDLGFIVKCDDGRIGQLRVPEMLSATLELDSDSSRSHIGTRVNVFTIRENESGCLFSEFSASERAKREELNQQVRDSQRRAKLGTKLDVTITRKLAWGCLCNEIGGLLKGVIPAPETIQNHNWHDRELQIDETSWKSLEENMTIRVVIVQKKEASWGT